MGREEKNGGGGRGERKDGSAKYLAVCKPSRLQISESPGIEQCKNNVLLILAHGWQWEDRYGDLAD